MDLYYPYLRFVKSIYPPLTYPTLFTIQKLYLAVHTSNAAQGLKILGHGHNLDKFDPLLGPLSFKSLHALM